MPYNKEQKFGIPGMYKDGTDGVLLIGNLEKELLEQGAKLKEGQKAIHTYKCAGLSFIVTITKD